MKRKAILFFLINLAFASYYIDTWGNANTTSRTLPVLSLVDQGTLAIDSLHEKTMDVAFVDKHYYSDKAPLPTLLTVPFYAAYKWLMEPAPKTDFDSYAKPVYLLGGFLCGSLPFAVIALLFFWYSAKKGGVGHAGFFTIAFLYSSFVFVFSGTFFSHVMASCLVLMSYVLLKQERVFFLSGFCLGAAVLTEYTTGLIAACWLLQIWINEKRFLYVWRFFLGLLPFIIGSMIYNSLTSGSAFDLLYNHEAHQEFIVEDGWLGFSHPKWEAILGLTVSPFRGLLIYCPAITFSFILLFHRRKIKINWLKNYLAIVCILYFLVIASHKVWWGGWSYGPRQLMPVAVLLMFEGVVGVSREKINSIWITAAALICIIITWVVKTTVVYSVPTEIKNPFLEFIPGYFKDGPRNECNVLSSEFSVSPYAAGMIWLTALLLFFAFFAFGLIREDLKRRREMDKALGIE